MKHRLVTLMALFLMCQPIQAAPPTGDLDGDGDVDFGDFLRFVQYFHTGRGDASYSPGADLNANGRIDQADFLILSKAFGRDPLHALSKPARKDIIWLEYPGNPVISSSDHRSYYPNLVAVGRHYRMYVDFADIDAGAAPIVYRTDDGIHFTQIGVAEGLRHARHTKVIYEKRGFSPGYRFKIFYWDTSVRIYAPDAMRTAESRDGIAWENDRPLEGNFVSGISGQVNGGTYGPSTIFFNRSRKRLDPDHPLRNRYVMYYVATTGAEERNAIAYSLDGTHFYYGGIALDIGGEGEWDARYASTATVIKNRGGYDMWYSGGVGDSNDGIGHATSTNGLTFVRDSRNPLLTTEPGTWHAGRTYTPMVLKVRGRFLRGALGGRRPDYAMYASGVSDEGVYSIGLYVGALRGRKRETLAAKQ